MVIKIICVLLLMIQCGLCLDIKNCTNSSEVFLSLYPHPKMKFYLFTHQNDLNGEIILSDNITTLINSYFDSQYPVRIIVHGWKSNVLSCFNAYVKDAYLKKGTFNVFVVDWGDWAQNMNYFEVVPYIYDTVGPLLAQFIEFLNIAGDISYNDLYLIGHGIGAHLAGIACQNLGRKKVNTIFGLDPAGPGFQDAIKNKRLDPSDAKYVEQIQTNMAETGYTGVIGHAAFFPNYGRKQSYCIRYSKPNADCSHMAAYWYFAESINTKIGFCSQRCRFEMILHLGFGCPKPKCKNSQTNVMGGEPSIRKHGSFYLVTNAEREFAICSC